jgi:VRR-NUC domain
MQPEQAIQRTILELLRWRGIFCWKNNTAGIYVRARNTYIPSHAPGVADILGILDSRFGRSGAFLAVEVKSPKGKLSPHQEAFLKEINDRGGLAIVARSVEDVEKALNDFVRGASKPNNPSGAGSGALRRAA